jgi:hypothetical protein
VSAVISHAIFNLRAVCQFDGDRGRKELLETSLQVVGLGLAWRGAAAGCMVACCMVACCMLHFVCRCGCAGRPCALAGSEWKPSAKPTGCAGLADIRLSATVMVRWIGRMQTELQQGTFYDGHFYYHKYAVSAARTAALAVSDRSASCTNAAHRSIER